MKYLSLVLFLLTGCFHATWYDNPAPSNWVGAAVYSNVNGVQVKCQEEEVNDKLVWIPCDFTNLTSEARRACINVSYFKNDTSSEVVSGRQICTLLSPNEQSRNYEAFITNKRDILTASCGVDLAFCRMVIKSF